MRFQQISRIETVILFLYLDSKVVSQHISSRLSFSQRLSSHVFVSSMKGLFIFEFFKEPPGQKNHGENW